MCNTCVNVVPIGTMFICCFILNCIVQELFAIIVLLCAYVHSIVYVNAVILT